MALEFRCAEVGLACGAKVTAATEDELVDQIAQHARQAHGVELTETLVDFAKTTARQS